MLPGVKLKLLIIDDNAAVRTSLKVVLSGVFDEIMAVGDPTLIPALLRNGDVDAVLLDMNFSTANLDGREGLIWLSKIKRIGIGTGCGDDHSFRRCASCCGGYEKRC